MPHQKPISIVLAIIGLSLQAGAYASIYPVVTGLVYLFLGLSVVNYFKKSRLETFFYLITYSIGLIGASLSVFYANLYFSESMTTPDAHTFYEFIFEHSDKNLFQLDEIMNSPLPVVVWSTVGSIFEFVAMPQGVWVFVQLNSLLVAFSSVLTIRSFFVILKKAKIKKRNPLRRVIAVGWMFALCGSCILFSSLLIRDSFALIINAVWFYSAVCILCNKTLKNIVIFFIVTILCVLSMLYVREKAAYLFGLFSAIVFVAWYLGTRFSPIKLLSGFIVSIVLISLYGVLAQGTQEAISSGAEKAENYSAHSKRTNKESSLGYSLIVNQPTPVRLLLGSGYTILQPIPLWNYFKLGSVGEYLVIKGYQGIFYVLIMPNVIFSLLLSYKAIRLSANLRPVLIFLVGYFFVSLGLVAVTTIETRHFGQFVHAMILLAGLVPAKTKNTSRQLNKIKKIWYGSVAAIHVMWLALHVL